MNESQTSFIEKQFFSPVLRVIIIAAVVLISAFSIVNRSDINSSPHFIPMIICVVISLFVFSMNLTFKIENNTFMYKLSPIHRKWRSIDISTITEASAITYRPIIDYGGWGIRYGAKGEWAFNMRGNKGVRVKTNDGKSIMFGSQKSEELAGLINKLMNKYDN